MKRRHSPLACLLLLAACSRAETPSAPEPPRAPATPPTVARAAAEPIGRERVDALLATWLEAQNTGDFARYEALYAERFDGVRRSRDRVVHLDRAGWVEDRRRMFARSMRVSIDEVEATSTSSVVNVRFVQRWASGRYSDEGPKRMLLVPTEDGSLRISIEEMLAARALRGLEATIAGGVFPVFSIGGEDFVVLGAASDAMASGRARLVSDAGVYLALRDVSARVPEDARALIGQRLRLYGGIETCEVDVRALGVAAVVLPHFGTVATWRGEDRDEDVPYTSAAIAAEVLSAAETHWLVARTDARCLDASVALRHATPALYAGAEVSSELRAQVLRQVMQGRMREDLRDSLSAEIETFGEEESAASPSSAELDRRVAERLEVHRFAREGAAREVVFVHAHFEGPCGGDLYTYLYELVDGRLVAHREAPDMLLLVLDIEGDGIPEIVGADREENETTIRRLGERPSELNAWARDNYDCNC